MVVVMAPEAIQEDVDGVVGPVHSAGGDAFVSRGVSRTIVGPVGDVDDFEALNPGSRRGVLQVMRVSVPYKLVSRGASPRPVRDQSLRRPHRSRHAERDRRAVCGGDEGADAQGRDDGQGGRGLAAVRRGVRTAHVPLLLPGPRRGGAEDSRRRTGDIVLCARGIRTFGTATRNTLDISAVPVVRRLSHLPVIVGPSHSGGRRDLVLPPTRAAIAAGADGVIIDVHPEPKRALCDGDQALVAADIRDIADAVAVLSPLMGRSLTMPVADWSADVSRAVPVP